MADGPFIVSDGKFRAEFFKRYGIQDFPLDQETLDSRSEFIDELAESFQTSGYDPQKPIIISTNDEDSRLTGIILDGRHRSITWQVMRNRGIIPSEADARKNAEKKKIFDRYLPKVELEYVADLDAVTARQAFYDLHNQTKNAAVSKKRAEKNIKTLLKRHPEITTLDEAIQFLAMKGFSNRKVVERIWKDMAREAAKQSKPKSPLHRVAQAFGLKNVDEDNPGVPEDKRSNISHEIAQTVEGAVTKYAHCPTCGNSAHYYVKPLDDGTNVLLSEPEFTSKAPLAPQAPKIPTAGPQAQAPQQQ